MKVVSYLRGIPNAKNQEKIDLLNFFVIGVNNSGTGDIGILNEDLSWKLSDVAVLQGFITNHGSKANKAPHLLLRKNVFDNQIKHNKSVIIADSNLFLYADPGNSKHYLRYSINGVFPTTGNYMWDDPDPSRWESISRNLNLKLKPWRKEGHHILICCQRNGGWSMGELDVVTWLHHTIKRIRSVSDRPIVVRGHPGDRKAKDYLKTKFKHVGVRVSTNEHILQDFANCWAVVTYNSSPGVAAAIEGIPVFITDPTPEVSQAYDIGNTKLKNIEKPRLADRQQWIEKISMCHWNFEEIKSGKAWKHMRNYV
jgi:hypothetical protein